MASIPAMPPSLLSRHYMYRELCLLVDLVKFLMILLLLLKRKDLNIRHLGPTCATTILAVPVTLEGGIVTALMLLPTPVIHNTVP
jgi:hypothetical protein